MTTVLEFDSFKMHQSPGYRDRRHGLEQIDSIPEHLVLHKTSERERPKEAQPAWENSSHGWFEAVHQW